MSTPGSRKVLIITYYWPPSGGAGVQRWLKFSKYLRDFGWEPVIYTPENPEAPAIDNSLEKDIPEGITVIKRPIIEPYSVYKRFVGMKPGEKVNAGFLQEKEKPGMAEGIAVWLRGNFFIPDARRFWIRPSVKFLIGYLKNNTVDAIVSTGPPHSMHMIALQIHQKLHIPWLADFRDPWTGIDFYHQLKLTSLADRLHHKLEKQVLSTATAVTVVSQDMADEFNRIVKRDYKLVTNGYDEQDFSPLPLEELDIKFTIAHIGSINASRNPIKLWKVLSEMVKANPEFARKLQIKLVGKVDIGVLKSIEENGLTAYLSRIEYMPHQEVMHEIQKSQVLLLSINNTPNAKGILTGKIFEYLGSGRPILSIGPEDGEAALILQEAEAGQTAGYENEVEMCQILTGYFTKYSEQRLKSNTGSQLKYSRKALTRKIAGILDSIISPGQIQYK
ncbi:MAG: glycosyltransferase family 4 protein [Bacteroidales bacterium]|nr:glycosyltransferase family 4 protein [Bacteroidales bacterium]